MADESPYIDYDNLPVPSEGIIATLFITVRKVAQSRDFYSRILGGKVTVGLRSPIAWNAMLHGKDIEATK